MEIENLLKEIEKTVRKFYKNYNIDINIKLKELEFCNFLSKKEKGIIEIDFTIF